MDTQNKKQEEEKDDIKLVNITPSNIKNLSHELSPGEAEKEVEDAVCKMNPDEQTLDRG